MQNNSFIKENLFSFPDNDFMSSDEYSINKLFTQLEQKDNSEEDKKEIVQKSDKTVKRDFLDIQKKILKEEELYHFLDTIKEEENRDDIKSNNFLLSNNNYNHNTFLNSSNNNLLLTIDKYNNTLNNSFNTIKINEMDFENFVEKRDLNNNSFLLTPFTCETEKHNNNMRENQLEPFMPKALFKIKKKLIQKIKNENGVIKPILFKRGPYNKKRPDFKELNYEDKLFPFKSGSMIVNIRSKFNFNCEEPILNNNDNNSNLNLNLDKTNTKDSSIKLDDNLFLMKFMIKRYYNSEFGRKKRLYKSRKYNSDQIRKKIKSKFHKTLKYIINDNLKKAGAGMLFDCLPQCFVTNINKSVNYEWLQLTLKQILSTDFSSQLENYRHTSTDKFKFTKNLKVVEFIESNPEISKKSGFDKIKNLKYKDILQRYFLSAEFDNSIIQMQKENESKEYIQSYIETAANYIKYFTNINLKNNKKKEIKKEDNTEKE